MKTAPTTVSRFSSVSSDYRHRGKLITPQPAIRIAGCEIKWYDIAFEDSSVSPQVRSMAIRFLEDEADYGELDQLGDLGFVILHRCGNEFYFLLLNSWRNENELWETTYAKRNSDEEYFALFPRPNTHKPTFCVWKWML